MWLTLQGSLVARACVHGKSTLQYAIEAVKQDICENISHRVEILLDDWQAQLAELEAEKINISTDHIASQLLNISSAAEACLKAQLPKRVFVSNSNGPCQLMFSLYMLPHESEKDMKILAQDLLGSHQQQQYVFDFTQETVGHVEESNPCTFELPRAHLSTMKTKKQIKESPDLNVKHSDRSVSRWQEYNLYAGLIAIIILCLAILIQS